jgi:hypothetical protein
MQELPPVERLALLFLRAWCDGGLEKARMIADFLHALGRVEGDLRYEEFNALLRMLLNGGRCPLMRRDLTCRCFGGHECAFVQMIAAAAAQDRDDALLFATMLMSGSVAWQAVNLAISLGPVILGIARAEPACDPAPLDRHLH